MIFVFEFCYSRIWWALVRSVFLLRNLSVVFVSIYFYFNWKTIELLDYSYKDTHFIIIYSSRCKINTPENFNKQLAKNYTNISKSIQFIRLKLYGVWILFWFDSLFKNIHSTYLLLPFKRTLAIPVKPIKFNLPLNVNVWQTRNF